MIQSKGIGRRHFAGQRGDFHPLVVIENHQFIVDNLNLDSRGIGLYKTGVHHVIGLDIAAAVEFRLPFRQSHLLGDGFHGTTCACHGQADVVPVNRGSTPIKAFVAGIANKPQADIGLVADLILNAAQMLDVTGRNNRFAVFEQDRIYAARRRVENTGDGFGTSGVRTQLGLIG